MIQRVRRRMTSTIAASGALVAAVVLLAACGSSTDSTTADASATPLPTVVIEPTPTAASVPVAAPTVDQAPASASPTASPTADAGDTAPSTTPPSDNPGLSLSGRPLTLRGMGELETGMTLDEAIEATGLSIVVRDDSAANEACQYAQVVGDPESPWLMLVGPADGFDQYTIVRIELAGSSSTLSGIHIGSTKADVLAAYGDRIEVSPHKYTFAEGGEYLTFVPADEADADYRLIFETLGDNVTEIRSGLLPAVEWVEGCL